MNQLRPLNYIPLGSMHPRDRCAYCGTSGSQRTLYQTMLFTTHAEAMVCEDPVKCLRTRKKAARNA